MNRVGFVDSDSVFELFCDPRSDMCLRLCAVQVICANQLTTADQVLARTAASARPPRRRRTDAGVWRATPVRDVSPTSTNAASLPTFVLTAGHASIPLDRTGLLSTYTAESLIGKQETHPSVSSSAAIIWPLFASHFGCRLGVCPEYIEF